MRHTNNYSRSSRSFFCRERDILLFLSFILCAAILGISWLTRTWTVLPESSLDGGDPISPVRLKKNRVHFATSTSTSKSTSTGMNQTVRLANRKDHEHGVHVFSIRRGPLPCERNSPEAAPRGIYYIKVPKTNSTHWQDIAKRIAGKDGKKCFLFDQHAQVSDELHLQNREKHRSLLFTFLREPRDWNLARYFHHYVAAHKRIPNPMDMKRFVSHNGNEQSRYIRLTPWEDEEDSNKSQSQSRAVAIAKEILRDYDFIGLVEEPELSLVVFRLLFGLEARDILYVPSALAGTITYLRLNGTCVPTGPQFVYPDVDDFMHSDEWIRANEIDLALYKEIRKSLEATIDHVLGRDTFEAALAEHKRLMAAVVSKCLFSEIIDAPPMDIGTSILIATKWDVAMTVYRAVSH
eukprot:CAMPEP_0198290138 /NCGR_PEP_ID=MMETSP1449-20131203/8102_1 /TAXON_ID=420275 /ORGANISM="Attheya septentrionalis, Strain CCMP2084" /LENGTH=406 /DNA_ID=CAMNT_0043988587 /DNA_START=170 /DNA_END=1391 /DNA_ORIENTATION=+